MSVAHAKMYSPEYSLDCDLERWASGCTSDVALCADVSQVREMKADSGCSMTMLKTKDFFVPGTFKPCNVGIQVAKSGVAISCTISGTAAFRFENDGEKHCMLLNGVLYVPDLHASLFSVGQATGQGYTFNFKQDHMKMKTRVDGAKTTVAVIPKINNTYPVKLVPWSTAHDGPLPAVKKSCAAANSAIIDAFSATHATALLGTANTKYKDHYLAAWKHGAPKSPEERAAVQHYRMGHQGKSGGCAPCRIAQGVARKEGDYGSRKAEHVGQYCCADLFGPVTPAGAFGEKYKCTLKDIRSKHLDSYSCHSQKEFWSVLWFHCKTRSIFHKHLEGLIDVDIRGEPINFTKLLDNFDPDAKDNMFGVLRHDNDPVAFGPEFQKIAKTLGITDEPVGAHSHYQAGAIESEFRVLAVMMIAMLEHGCAPGPTSYGPSPGIKVPS